MDSLRVSFESRGILTYPRFGPREHFAFRHFPFSTLVSCSSWAILFHSFLSLERHNGIGMGPTTATFCTGCSGQPVVPREEGLEIGKHAEAVFQSRVQSKSTRRRTRGTGRKKRKEKKNRQNKQDGRKILSTNRTTRQCASLSVLAPFPPGGRPLPSIQLPSFLPFAHRESASRSQAQTVRERANKS